ncbi:hypothetical protein M3226_23005 [Neobacillus cucumis]|uniref:hypothetical protein n=1 Tax=Neobacillus cucumis TaxID=1740721 RepID=UPI00203CC6DE|nr:hypothetical protein [Neobacillus cucumis]MCM3728522.1 hypothetical protein [Neobacillus cucumis]
MDNNLRLLNYYNYPNQSEESSEMKLFPNEGDEKMTKFIEKMKVNNVVTGWVDDHAEELMDWSTKIWNYAELGLQEYQSSKLLANQLEKEGFSIEMGVAGMPTAFVATWGKGKSVIGILGEYYALPGLSQKLAAKKEPITPEASGHGCGHNIYGVARLVGRLRLRNGWEKKEFLEQLNFMAVLRKKPLLERSLWQGIMFLTMQMLV